ncbi:MAG: pyridoxal-phosphate dependent enzyme [Candidatus Pelagadaptatus aseana]|uniref:1-aminocyclopropane-1-carboxylate deaminase/D-cysteine desulfhydrase n=1 Tax=Candidatus Pelagadaptatus aseana TaxID=3120508 RepID=UPI0039B23268
MTGWPDTSRLRKWLGGDIERLTAQQPLQQFVWKPLNDLGIDCWIKRDDLLHPLISGNKLYKLWGHLQQARRQKAQSLVSFGGAYSNHLHALAAAGQALGYETHGVIRGHRPKQLSPTLSDCESLGMKLMFAGYQEYRDKERAETVKAYIESLHLPYLIPEGGGGTAGAEYCSALMKVLRQGMPGPATVCLPCGTGTTLQGLVQTSHAAEKFLGFGVLKPSNRDREGQWTEMEQRIADSVDVRKTGQWRITFDYHGGGYAKASPELLDFIVDFEGTTGIPLEPVYSGKMMWGILQLAQQGFWPAGSRVVAIHTGGLQGRRGFSKLPPLEQQSEVTSKGVCHSL